MRLDAYYLVRAHRSKVIHACLKTDARNPLCSRRIKRLIVEPDITEPTCQACLLAMTTN